MIWKILWILDEIETTQNKINTKQGRSVHAWLIDDMYLRTYSPRSASPASSWGKLVWKGFSWADTATEKWYGLLLRFSYTRVRFEIFFFSFLCVKMFLFLRRGWVTLCGRWSVGLFMVWLLGKNWLFGRNNVSEWKF